MFQRPWNLIKVMLVKAKAHLRLELYLVGRWMDPRWEWGSHSQCFSRSATGNSWILCASTNQQCPKNTSVHYPSWRSWFVWRRVITRYSYPRKMMCSVNQTIEQWQNTVWSYCAEDYLRTQTCVQRIQHSWTAFSRTGTLKWYPRLDWNLSTSVAWYLPYHPVMNLNKPDKVCVVFNCAAQYNRVSLNSKPLQGPDLTNNLVGVLICFCEEPVAITADIKGMFHQASVSLRIAMLSTSHGGQKTILIRIQKTTKCLYIYLAPLCPRVALISA